MRFLEIIFTLAIIICIVCWLFETNFLLLDILLMFALIALQIIIPLIILVAMIWAIKELFG
jgi:hypothetical protein